LQPEAGLTYIRHRQSYRHEDPRWQQQHTAIAAWRSTCH